jgi:acetolactate synthase-1/2/3 large subunit
VPLTRIEPAPDFTKIAAASRCHAARVERAAELPEALAAAIAHVRTRRQQALVEVVIG